jgi:Fur family ferric uptake transcriptional regulator
MLQNAIKLLESKEITPTAARQLVLTVFLQKDYALTLTDIENELPWSDRATIFRTFKTFEEKALIHQISGAEKSVKYALCTDSCDTKHHEVHPHYTCERCKKTVCMTSTEITIPDLPLEFKVNSVSLTINGICPDCR